MSTQAPTFTQPLQNVVALEGSAATFEAQVSGKKLVPVIVGAYFVLLVFLNIKYVFKSLLMLNINMQH